MDHTKIKSLFTKVIAIALLFIAIVLVINSRVFDQDIAPEVEQNLHKVSMPPNKGNAYFSFIGINVAPGEDPQEFGEQAVEDLLNPESAEQPSSATVSLEQSDKRSKAFDAWKNSFIRCKARVTGGCLAAIQAQAEPISPPSARLEEMLNRYSSLTEMKTFQEPELYGFDHPLPPFGDLMSLQQIQFALASRSVTQQEFVELLAKDTAFWRMVLKDSQWLISKMVALAALWSNLQYANDYNIAHSLTPSQQAHLGKVFTALTPQELDIGEAFLAEHRLFSDWIKNDISHSGNYGFGRSNWLIGLLFQPDATINGFYFQTYKPMDCISKLDRPTFVVSYRALESGGLDNECGLSLDRQPGYTPASLYNLGGKLFAAANTYNPHEYVARVHDLNGMFALLRINLGGQINNESQYIDTLKTSLAKSHEVSFDCLDTDSRCVLVKQ